jgi:hypothetical protein
VPAHGECRNPDGPSAGLGQVGALGQGSSQRANECVPGASGIDGLDYGGFDVDGLLGSGHCRAGGSQSDDDGSDPSFDQAACEFQAVECFATGERKDSGVGCREDLCCFVFVDDQRVGSMEDCRREVQDRGKVKDLPDAEFI